MHQQFYLRLEINQLIIVIFIIYILYIYFYNITQMQDPVKQAKYLALLKSLNLPSDLLIQTQYKKMKLTEDSSKKQLLTLDFQKSMKFSVSGDKRLGKPSSARYEYKTKSTESKKKMIIQNQLSIKPDSLYKRLRKMRKQNQSLKKFSLSKLLSNIKLLNHQKIQKEFLQVELEKEMKQLSKSTKIEKSPLKQKLYTFTDKKIKSFQNLSNSAQKKNQQGQSSKIFRRYYCPPSNYRESVFSHDLPQNSFVYRNGKKIQCKRIHNFYSSHMYRRGFSRHCKITNQDDDLAFPHQLEISTEKK